jgi:hypothetical protein
MLSAHALHEEAGEEEAARMSQPIAAHPRRGLR